MRTWLIVAGFSLVVQVQARDFHLDGRTGKDSNDGTTANSAWRSLEKANAFAFEPGDRLLLKRGSRFEGGLKLKLMGTPDRPLVIEAYGKGADPLIDARGYQAGVHLTGSHHVVVRDLEITADGGKTVIGPKDRRYGVYVDGSHGRSSHVTLENLTISRIFPEVGAEHEGRNETTFLGTGISIEGSKDEISLGFIVRNCHIALTGFMAINMKRIKDVQVLGNTMKDIGGPAMQPGTVENLLVRGNTVDGSGSDKDKRMHMRGSGIWPWSCSRVLIEKNKFLHARGGADSCGVHIDFGCRDVVVQHNLSIDNAGGFVEILGNNHNCAYRYNISVNDGFREKGRNHAFQEGKILWTSGFVGKNRLRHGPYNTYIYNNTIYVQPESRSCFSIAKTTEGLLVANNIFHILGKTEDVLGDQKAKNNRRKGPAQRLVADNNLYFSGSVLPKSLSLKDGNMIVGDPRFEKPGGFDAESYIPRNVGLIQDRGIAIRQLVGDDIGVRLGLEVKEDFFGTPIVGKPDLGAIELSR